MTQLDLIHSLLTMILNDIHFYIEQLKTSFVSLPTTFQIKIAKEAFIEGKKEEEGMKEKGLWQNQNNRILGWIKKPSIISHKENLMEKSKELVKTNQHSPKTDHKREDY